MKILLIRPDRLDIHLDTRNHTKRLGDLHQPIGLLYLAAMLEKEQAEVKICDEVADDNSREIIDKFVPDVVGITVTSPLMPRASQIAAYAKQKGCKVLLGGPHVSALPIESLKESKADAVAVGEGEYTIRELCSGESWNNIKGIAYWRDSEPVLNQLREQLTDLDELPFPARHLVDFQKYKGDIEFGFPLKSGDTMLRVLSARGCPFYCTNCCSHKVFGRKHRLRNPGKIITEIEEAIQKWNIKTFTFIDDDFTLNRDHLQQICQLLIAKKLEIKWSCYARVGTSLESLQLMKQAGCRLVAYGVESGSPEVLKRLNKQIGLAEIINTFKNARQAKIRTKAFFIIGLPGEDETEFKKSLSLASKLKPDFLWASIFMPLPGSQIYNDMGGYEKVKVNWGTDSFFHSENKLLEKRHKQFLTTYYFSLRYLKTFLKFLSLADIRYYLQMFRVYITMFLDSKKNKN